MAITYTPATNFGAKDSLPTNDPAKVIKGSEFTTEFAAIQSSFNLAAPAASPTFTGTSTFDNIAATGTVTLSTVDINGGTIDGVTLATSDVTVGAGKTLDVSAGTLTLANDQISGDSVEGGTIGSITITSADINGGNIDGAIIGDASPAAGTFSSLTASSTVSFSGATVSNGGSVTTIDINGGTIDGTSIGGNTPSTGVFTFLETEGAFTENAEAITSSSNAATLDLSVATNFTHSLSEDVTYTFSNPAASGKASAFTLKTIQDATARTITWPASVEWSGGTAPTLSAGSGNADYFVFITTDGGTTYYGFTSGQAFAAP